MLKEGEWRFLTSHTSDWKRFLSGCCRSDVWHDVSTDATHPKFWRVLFFPAAGRTLVVKFPIGGAKQGE